MNAAELLRRVRHRLDDTAGNDSSRLWKDWEIIDDYANQALRTMFLTVRQLKVDATTTVDSASVPLCRIPIVAGTARYAVSSKIIRIARFMLASQQYPIPRRSIEELDLEQPGWDGSAATSGVPYCFCDNAETGYITLVPTPSANDTASLRVFRFPLADISLDSVSELDFPTEYHNDLIPGILALAWSKQDSEAKNEKLAAQQEARFINRLDEIKLELIRKYATVHTNRP